VQPTGTGGLRSRLPVGHRASHRPPATRTGKGAVLGFCGPTLDKRSWTFDLDPRGVRKPGLRSTVAIPYLHSFSPTIRKASPSPRSSDVRQTVVTNDFPQMTLICIRLSGRPTHRYGAPQLYPMRCATSRRVGKLTTPNSHGVYRRVPGRLRRYDAGRDRCSTALTWSPPTGQKQAVRVATRSLKPMSGLFTTWPASIRSTRALPVHWEHAHRMPVAMGLRRDCFRRRGFLATKPSTCSIKRTLHRACPISTRRDRCRGSGALLTGFTQHGREAFRCAGLSSAIGTHLVATIRRRRGPAGQLPLHGALERRSSRPPKSTAAPVNSWLHGRPASTPQHCGAAYCRSSVLGLNE